jgi:hypothetical protein
MRIASREEDARVLFCRHFALKSLQHPPIILDAHPHFVPLGSVFAIFLPLARPLQFQRPEHQTKGTTP